MQIGKISLEYFLTAKRSSSYSPPYVVGCRKLFAVSPISSHSPIDVITCLEYLNISSSDDFRWSRKAVAEKKIELNHNMNSSKCFPHVHTASCKGLKITSEWFSTYIGVSRSWTLGCSSGRRTETCACWACKSSPLWPAVYPAQGRQNTDNCTGLLELCSSPCWGTTNTDISV